MMGEKILTVGICDDDKDDLKRMEEDVYKRQLQRMGL